MNNDKLIKLWKKSILLNSDKVEAPPICLEIIGEKRNSIFGTLGNFSIIAGKPKSRKTFFTSLLTGISLNNSSLLRVKASFPENKRKIIYFDTEQGRYHAKKVLKRISKIANIQDDEHHKNLQFILLRQYSPKERLEIIDYVISNSTNVGLVVIDGIKDVVNSINDEHEATKTATKLMEWTAKYDIHIITVLHQNKNDENIRGHLGSELENKAETVVKVAKISTSPDFSVVKPKSLRDTDFNDFSFGINEDNIPYEVGNIADTTKKKPEPSELNKTVHIDIIGKIYSKKRTYKYADLIQNIKKEFETEHYTYGVNKCKQILTYYIENEYIKKDEISKVYVSAFENDLPF